MDEQEIRDQMVQAVYAVWEEYAEDLDRDYGSPDTLVGLEMALDALVAAGANDPRREAKPQPETVQIETDEGILRFEL